jgi:SAM-dependent methyltransferase
MSTVSAYDRIGLGYDATRRADPYIAERLAHHLATDGSAGEPRRYLDLACGTGNYTTALSMKGDEWYGVDRSSRMIANARPKTRDVRWCQARAEHLPFPDSVFSGAMCTLALHHFDELGPIFREVYRVLDRGKLVIFTAGRAQMRGYWLNEYFPESMRRSIDQMPDVRDVEDNLYRAGFSTIETETYDVRPDLQDLFLYSGKQRPQLYLEEGFRSGISTFSSLASPGEVAEGCERLEKDLETGRIAEVTERYSNDSGDYLFILASKTVS